MSKKSATGLSLILLAIGLALLVAGVVVAVLLARSASEKATSTRDLPRVRVTPAGDAGGRVAEVPAFAEEVKRPTESELVFSRRADAKKRYLAWVEAEGMSTEQEHALRAFLYDYQRRFFAARVANITGASDAGTAEEQIRAYQALDVEAMRSLRRLLGEARTRSFLSTFKHPRALIVHRFFAE